MGCEMESESRIPWIYMFRMLPCVKRYDRRLTGYARHRRLEESSRLSTHGYPCDGTVPRPSVHIGHRQLDGTRIALNSLDFLLPILLPCRHLRRIQRNPPGPLCWLLVSHKLTKRKPECALDPDDLCSGHGERGGATERAARVERDVVYADGREACACTKGLREEGGEVGMSVDRAEVPGKAEDVYRGSIPEEVA